jgi:hypothetical protein
MTEGRVTASDEANSTKDQDISAQSVNEICGGSQDAPHTVPSVPCSGVCALARCLGELGADQSHKQSDTRGNRPPEYADMSAASDCPARHGGCLASVGCFTMSLCLVAAVVIAGFYAQRYRQVIDESGALKTGTDNAVTVNTETSQPPPSSTPDLRVFVKIEVLGEMASLLPNDQVQIRAVVFPDMAGKRLEWRVDGELGEPPILTMDTYDPCLVYFRASRPGNHVVAVSVQSGGASDAAQVHLMVSSPKPTDAPPIGEVPTATSTPQTGTIALTCFVDLDQNGRRDPGEPSVQDFAVELRSATSGGTVGIIPRGVRLSGQLAPGRYEIAAQHACYTFGIQSVEVGVGQRKEVELVAILPAPMLVAPASGATVNQQIAAFRWAWQCQPDSALQYWLRVWKGDYPDNTRDRASQVVLDVPTFDSAWQWWPEQGQGIYTWSVCLVSPSDPKTVIVEGAPRVFFYIPPPRSSPKSPTSFPTPDTGQ